MGTVILGLERRRPLLGWDDGRAMSSRLLPTHPDSYYRFLDYWFRSARCRGQALGLALSVSVATYRFVYHASRHMGILVFFTWVRHKINATMGHLNESNE